MAIILRGFIGVVWDHIIMGLELSMPSIMDTISLSDIVVNVATLLVEFPKLIINESLQLEISNYSFEFFYVAIFDLKAYPTLVIFLTEIPSKMLSHHRQVGLSSPLKQKRPNNPGEQINLLRKSKCKARLASYSTYVIQIAEVKRTLSLYIRKN